MRWEDIEEQFDLDIPEDEPIFPVNIVCKLLDLQYYTLHEIVKEGILNKAKKAKKKETKKKKLFSFEDMKALKYIKHLVEEEGVNIKGVKIILKLKEERE